MDTKISFKVISNRLPTLAAELRDNAARIVATSAAAIETQAKIAAPVDTGNLRNSIQMQDGATDLQKVVEVGADYGIFVELGVRGRPGQPYLIPAVEAEAPRFLDAMNDLIK